MSSAPVSKSSASSGRAAYCRKSTELVYRARAHNTASNSAALSPALSLSSGPLAFGGARRGCPMKIDEIMTRNVRGISPDETLGTAAQIMWENDCGAVPVVETDGRLVGIVTDRDICMAAHLQGAPL